ncbi:MAG TPA: nucleotidyltransferase domain-containing protein [Anaerolineales bacterium]|nr:nucleotidyltransferase domain-containing protein [Anaerolineales bacterium]
MQLQATYPTLEHQSAAETIVDFFVSNYKIDAVLLVNSCARGKATRDSCLDIVVLAKPDPARSQLKALEAGWEELEKSSQTIKALYKAGKYSVVHPDFINGVFTPREQDEAAGPDDFEIQIGNFLAYSVPLWEGSDYFRQLKGQWLPYYAEELRQQRLDRVRWFCLNNLQHIPLYIERGLYFQSFDRLYNAYQEFLQALFIARRTYPIAYNKWIREEVEEILGLPELYVQLSHLFEIRQFESSEIADKAKEVEQLLEKYAPSPNA